MTQEAFIKLWENCADVPPEKAKSFLYTVANNASLNQIAHQKVVLNYTKNNTLNDRTNVNPEYIFEEEQFKVKLETAIANLTEGQRTAFLLNRIEGKKYAEIAEMLDISVKAVEKRIHGALVSLRANIEEFKQGFVTHTCFTINNSKMEDNYKLAKWLAGELSEAELRTFEKSPEFKT